MAKRGRPRTHFQLVWLGDDEGTLSTVWKGVTFLRGVPTDVSDPYLVQKAKGNPYYEVVE